MGGIVSSLDPSRDRRRFLVIFFLVIAGLAPTTRHRNLGDCGGSSRLATAESLVERGSFAIDGSTLAFTCDVMTRDGLLYSDKPPVLSLLAAGVYAFLHHGLGLSFNPRAVPLGADPPHDHTYALMTFLVIATAQALLVATFDRGLGVLGVAGARRTVGTLTIAFSTLLWPLAGLFNSHTPAALLILAGLYFGLLRSRPLAAGLSLGFATTVDIPVGGLVLALAFVLLPSRRAVFVAGALLPLALHGFFNWWIVGDLVPFQLHRELYTEATGHTGESATGFAQSAGIPFYAVRNLFGSLGVFALTPLLLMALPLALGVALRPGPWRQLARIAVISFVATAALYIVPWPEAVGCSYGMRHLVPVTPPLLLVATTALAKRRTIAAYTGLAALSALLAGGGLLDPTTCAGFVEDARGWVPARVFFSNVAGAAKRVGWD